MDALDLHITTEFTDRLIAATYRYMENRGLAFKPAVFAVAADWRAEGLRQGSTEHVADLIRVAAIRAGARHGRELLDMGMITRAELDAPA